MIGHDEDLLAACIGAPARCGTIVIRAAVMRDHRAHRLAGKCRAHLAGQAGEDEQRDDQLAEHLQVLVGREDSLLACK